MVLLKRNIYICAALAAIVCSWQPAPVSSQEEKPSTGELIVKAWQAHGERDEEKTFAATQKLIDLYKEEADKQQASLTSMPKTKEEIYAVQVLNDVATAYFIRAEVYMRRWEKAKAGGASPEALAADADEAVKLFKMVVEKYPYGQAWDPRGWFWSIAEASRKSMDKIMGTTTAAPKAPPKPTVSQKKTTITLYDPGKNEMVVNYAAFGAFTGVGTEKYQYQMRDQEGLSVAVGEGIYPNTNSVRWDPAFKQAMKEKRLEGSHWDFVHSPDLEAAFLKWSLSPEPTGVRLFYTGLMLERSGQIKHAIKCYYAIVVHFPGSYGWTYFKTPWYVGQAAIAKINFLLRRNPQLGYRLNGADIYVKNGFDNDVSNDVVIVNPGRFEKINVLERFKPKAKPAVSRTVGKGKVTLARYKNGDWQLLVGGKPYFIKGITYEPTKVGQSPDEGSLANWTLEDTNGNGKIDGPVEAFVDANGNNKQDADEPAIGDFELMRRMGVNTIRLYHHPRKPEKEILRRLYEKYGIRVIMGDFLGKYALGSGAPWTPGTDYNNEEHKKNMLKSVTDMVTEFKDEPYILMWLLGNENVYGYACNADTQPDAFYRFANEAATMMKSLDGDHPVALCNGDVLFLDKFGKNCPDIDIFSANAYRGNYGFGFLWRQVRVEADKPAFITEYGCSARSDGMSDKESESAQADYHRGSWEDIVHNSAFQAGAGNSIGGVAFEWLDEWWKAYEPFVHDAEGTWIGPFPDGKMHEEWLGLCGQGDGTNSPFLRHLRQAYFTYQKEWTGNGIEASSSLPKKTSGGKEVPSRK